MKNFLTLKSLANLTHMFRFETSDKKIGTLPGTILYTGEEELEKSYFKATSYSARNFHEEEVEEIEDISEDANFISFFGIQDVKKMGKIGEKFNIHNLVLEDIANVSHSLKFEEEEDMLLVLLKTPKKKGGEYSGFEHLGIVLKDNYIVTFHETAKDPFLDLREKMRKGVGRIRQRPVDYLFYLLVDQTVDRYYPLLDYVEDRVFEIDTSISQASAKEGVEKIQSLRTLLHEFHKFILPLKDVSSGLLKSDTKLMSDELDRYLRDLQDHTFYIVHSVRSLSERMDSLMDLMLSVSSFRLNEVMKTLTVVATIFMPLTFIAGVYGMNFKNMPELDHPYGYFIALAAMGAIALAMGLFLRLKRWF